MLSLMRIDSYQSLDQVRVYNMIIHQMDVKITFLNGELDEEVYMNQPQSFIMSGNENKVCKLVKSLYGLVTDMSKVDKYKAKRTKPSTKMERVQEIEAEGKFILNPILLILKPKRNPKTISPLDSDDDYDNESIISTNTDIFETPLSIVITTSHPVLPIEDPEVSLIMGNEELNTIPEKESDEFIKSSVEDLVLIPCESEDTSRSDSECILPSCNDFSPIDIPKEKAVTFSNPFFNSNDDFICSDNESLSDEDVPEDNVKIYSNSLFEFDDEYISSVVNPLFDEAMLMDLLVTPLSDANDDECFDSGGDVDEIDYFEDGYYDSEGDILYLESLLSDDTTPNLPPEVFLDRDLRSLSDAPIDNLMSEDKIFIPEICVFFSPTYDCSDFKDSRAHGFVHHPLVLLSLAYGNLISSILLI
nr:zinc finger, CCHC-type [Tanacetum cinerariifolium]